MKIFCKHIQLRFSFIFTNVTWNVFILKSNGSAKFSSASPQDNCKCHHNSILFCINKIPLTMGYDCELHQNTNYFFGKPLLIASCIEITFLFFWKPLFYMQIIWGTVIVGLYWDGWQSVLFVMSRGLYCAVGRLVLVLVNVQSSIF